MSSNTCYMILTQPLNGVVIFFVFFSKFPKNLRGFEILVGLDDKTCHSGLDPESNTARGRMLNQVPHDAILRREMLKRLAFGEQQDILVKVGL